MSNVSRRFWPAVVMTGQYTDALVKTANGWRFKSREVKHDAGH